MSAGRQQPKPRRKPGKQHNTRRGKRYTGEVSRNKLADMRRRDAERDQD